MKDHLQEVVPADGKAEMVRAVAKGDIQLYRVRCTPSMRPIAKAVANPALRCELVDGGQAWKTLASFVTPEYFEDFAEVIFMAALFENTILFHLWSNYWDIHFRPHEDIGRFISRDVHSEQGPFISIAHVLHEDDNASRYNLERNWKTGRANAKRGDRVIDRAVQLAGELFKGSKFLLQTNNWHSARLAPEDLPKGAIPIKVNSHGLNEYKGYTRAASLAITNPDNHEARWLVSRTGLDPDKMYLAYRIHTVYQAVGRTAIRDYGNAVPKVFLVAGKEDAEYLHKLFQGSRWIGKVGDVPSLKQLTQKNRKPKLVDSSQYARWRNRRDALKRKIRKGTISEPEAKELEQINSRLADLKMAADGA
ncbi:hypothetical protein D6C00_08095 [Thiohalobacter thiocyanaticus]|uniref:Uncharacterized protein n=1 Tax=Thiohalobacter thiocyanaticus TaxID=585455 RepID=A0A426QJG8_9GAMM|nr:hypothetical protein D6C00_08095 [Thiohalobacter thiocyanaticus]